MKSTVSKSDSTGLFSLGIPAAAEAIVCAHLDIHRIQQEPSPTHFPPTGKPITQTSELDRHDWHAMVIFLMVDRFKNGDSTNDWACEDPGIRPEANHYGGDFAGIASSLDYIQDLGANTIWVGPIANPDGAWGYWSDSTTDVTSKFSGYHGYWPITSAGTDRRFGTMEEFNALVEAIHEGTRTSWSITWPTTCTKNIPFTKNTPVGHQSLLAK